MGCNITSLIILHSRAYIGILIVKSQKSIDGYQGKPGHFSLRGFPLICKDIYLKNVHNVSVKFCYLR